MTKADVSQKLPEMVRQAKATASRVLHPVALSRLQAIALDADALLSGLQSRESLTGFHPFADVGCPEADTPRQQSQRTQRNGGSTASFSDTKEVGGHTADTAGQGEVEAVHVLNQDFTELVEQVFHLQLAGTSQASVKASERSESKSSLSAGNKPLTTASSKSVTQPVVSTTGLENNTAASDAEIKSGQLDGRGSDSADAVHSSATHPVFQQLESLVTELMPLPDAISQESSNSTTDKRFSSGAENPSPVATAVTSKLADLTRVLVRNEPNAKTGVSRPDASPLNRSPLVSSQGRAVGEKTPAPARRQPVAYDVYGQPSGFKGQDMADSIRRHPGISLREQVLPDAYGTQGLSPVMTQHMADALNEYLQEQAERHGVDLS